MNYTFKREHAAHNSQPLRPAFEIVQSIGEILARPSGTDDKCLAALKELSLAS